MTNIKRTALHNSLGIWKKTEPMLMIRVHELKMGEGSIQKMLNLNSYGRYPFVLKRPLSSPKMGIKEHMWPQIADTYQVRTFAVNYVTQWNRKYTKLYATLICVYVFMHIYTSKYRCMYMDMYWKETFKTVKGVVLQMICLVFCFSKIFTIICII